MIRRRSIVGLALLAAFAFMAISASGASAAWQTAESTTAFTCVFEGGAKDFSNSHCDNHVNGGTGEYGHVPLSSNPTDIEVVQVGTAHLTGEVAAIEIDIACTSSRMDPSVTSYIENTLNGTKHDVNGKVVVELTNCAEEGELAGICEVEDPITVNSKFRGVEEPTNNPKTMGLQFEPTGVHFAALRYEAGCVIGTGPFNIDGSFIGTSNTGSQSNGWSGATVKLEGGAMSSLTFAGNPAAFEDTFTVKMPGGNPIALTTN